MYTAFKIGVGLLCSTDLAQRDELQLPRLNTPFYFTIVLRHQRAVKGRR